MHGLLSFNLCDPRVHGCDTPFTIHPLRLLSWLQQQKPTLLMLVDLTSKAPSNHSLTLHTTYSS